MNTKLRRQLVSALLACDSMSDRHTRDTIVDELPDDIRHTIRRHSADRVDVTNIVKACLNYHEGLEELIEAVRSHEGNSTAMQQLDELMK